MSKKLIIAEKRSVAKQIAAVLGVNGEKEGYLEGTEYVISWCIGHLVELSPPDAYDERYTTWRAQDLPIIPSAWRYKVPTEKCKQFKTLKYLLFRDDICEVINACDAGREGELIFRNLYNYAGCDKPILRLWISSMEDDAIRNGLSNMKPGADYDKLFRAAQCRELADWLVGFNASRLFSVLYHRTLNVGRVVSPTLAILVQRSAEIEAFQSEPYYFVELDFGDFTASGERFKTAEEANAVFSSATDGATVHKVEQKEKTERAPALYDLTTLQREANRVLGFTAQETLDHVQALYEKKLCTYPRTDSRYLPDEMEDAVRDLTLNAAEICEADSPFAALSDQVCNSKKVSDHHAIILTKYAKNFDIRSLPKGEREILLLIAKQMLRAVSGPHCYTETPVEIDCGGHLFKAKGKNILDIGWKQYSEKASSDKSLPDLAEGYQLTVQGKEIKTGNTKPPAQYTEDSLLAAMEAAGANEMPEDAERTGLGTPATRAGIIEKLVAAGFVERRKAKKNTHLVPASVGVSLITVLPEQLQSPLLTAEWESKLKQVELGEMSAQVFMEEISVMVNELVRNYTVVRGAEVLFPTGKPIVGKCPRCGNNVSESARGYFCESNDCRFQLWKDNKFLAEKRITLTPKLVEKLLSDGGAYVRNIFSARKRKSYDATILLVDDGVKAPRFMLDFGNGILD